MYAGGAGDSLAGAFLLEHARVHSHTHACALHRCTRWRRGLCTRMYEYIEQERAWIDCLRVCGSSRKPGRGESGSSEVSIFNRNTGSLGTKIALNLAGPDHWRDSISCRSPTEVFYQMYTCARVARLTRPRTGCPIPACPWSRGSLGAFLSSAARLHDARTAGRDFAGSLGCVPRRMSCCACTRGSARGCLRLPIASVLFVASWPARRAASVPTCVALSLCQLLQALCISLTADGIFSSALLVSTTSERLCSVDKGLG